MKLGRRIIFAFEPFSNNNWCAALKPNTKSLSTQSRASLKKINFSMVCTDNAYGRIVDLVRSSHPSKSMLSPF